MTTKTRTPGIAVEASIRRVRWLIREIYGSSPTAWARKWLVWAEDPYCGLAAANQANHLESAAEGRLAGVDLTERTKLAMSAAAATISMFLSLRESPRIKYPDTDWSKAASDIRDTVNQVAATLPPESAHELVRRWQGKARSLGRIAKNPTGTEHLAPNHQRAEARAATYIECARGLQELLDREETTR